MQAEEDEEDGEEEGERERESKGTKRWRRRRRCRPGRVEHEAEPGQAEQNRALCCFGPQAPISSRFSLSLYLPFFSSSDCSSTFTMLSLLLSLSLSFSQPLYRNLFISPPTPRHSSFSLSLSRFDFPISSIQRHTSWPIAGRKKPGATEWSREQRRDGLYRRAYTRGSRTLVRPNRSLEKRSDRSVSQRRLEFQKGTHRQPQIRRRSTIVRNPGIDDYRRLRPSKKRKKHVHQRVMFIRDRCARLDADSRKIKVAFR